MPTYLPVADLAQRLGRAENTIRLWARHHGRHIDRSRDERGAATYPLERMIEIRSLYDQGMSAREVGRELDRRAGDADEVAPADPVVLLLTEIRDELIRLREMMEANRDDPV